MNALEANNLVFVGPLKETDEGSSFENLMKLNQERGIDIQHIPQILEIGRVIELDEEEETVLVNFSTYQFVLPSQAVSVVYDEEIYYKMLDDLDIFYYDPLSKIIYLRKTLGDDKEFYKRIKEGVGFNDPDILALTKATVGELLQLYITSSDFVSIVINGAQITTGTCKTMWNYICYKEDNPGSYFTSS
jgi:hypothetical protein